jgi:hypothetical protein
MQQQLPPHPRRKLADSSLDDLADALGTADPGSGTHTAAMAEFTRREALAQERVVQAQEAAATAAIATAEATRRSARYMLWSVIALVVTSVLSLGWNLWEHH